MLNIDAIVPHKVQEFKAHIFIVALVWNVIIWM